MVCCKKLEEANLKFAPRTQSFWDLNPKPESLGEFRAGEALVEITSEYTAGVCPPRSWVCSGTTGQPLVSRVPSISDQEQFH